MTYHPGRNSFWIKKNRASDYEGKFHTYLKVRIWIWNKKFNFSLDIRVSMNLAFFWENLVLFDHSCTGNTLTELISNLWWSNFCWKNTEETVLQPDVASTRVLKKSQIFSKNANFTLTLMSMEKLNFLFQIQILTFKYVWNLPSLSLARFFLIQNELRPGWIKSASTGFLFWTEILLSACTIHKNYTTRFTE